MHTENWYRTAEQRVNETPELEPYRVDCLYDWTEVDHYEWVATAPLAEILSWAAGVGGEE